MGIVFTRSNNKLSQLRSNLDGLKKSGFQRSYDWTFQSLKLLILRNDLKVISVTHPFVNFTSEGEYMGYIAGYTKPSEITITFLETDTHHINTALEFWDNLKYNPNKGVMYPKAVYEDQAKITYSGSEGEGANNRTRTRTYTLSGVYPINRSNIELNYTGNDILTVQVGFNVDSIQPLLVI